jgi:hypothetical protein
MKFLKYINENWDSMEAVIKRDDVVKILKQDCGPFLEFCKYNKIVFSRITPYGSTIYPGNQNYIKKYPHQNRQPTDTPPILSTMIDDLFYRKFGWKVRSSGVFTSPNSFIDGIADQLCFIIGNFSFVTSPKVSDLYVILGELSRRIYIQNKIPEIERPLFKQITHDHAAAITYAFEKQYLNTFTDTKLSNEVKNHHKEVVFDCHSYYLVKSWTFETPEDFKLL